VTTTEMVSEYLEFFEGINPTSGNVLPKRRRAKRNAQRVADRTWGLRNWPWKIAEATLSAGASLLASADPDLPADFLRFGKSGGVYLEPNQPPVHWMALAELLRRRKLLGRRGRPDFYSVGNQSVAGVKKLLLEPAPETAVDVFIVYEPLAPRLVDELDEEDADEFQGTDGLARFPEQYHRTVIFEGMRYYMMEDKANSQSLTEQLGLWRAGERDMIVNELQGIEAPHRLPPFRPGRR
jgi:hypothetical protein